jgi:Holliday junction resolvase
MTAGGASPRRKGSQFERSVVGYLRDNGFPQAARTLAGASDDRGDISGVGNCVLECKCAARIDLAGWLAEARLEAENAGLPRFAVVAKRRGVADVAESYAVVPLWLLAELLREEP